MYGKKPRANGNVTTLRDSRIIAVILYTAETEYTEKRPFVAVRIVRRIAWTVLCIVKSPGVRTVSI